MKKLSLFLVVMLCLPLFLVGCDGQKETTNSYKIFATYDDQAQTLTCEQEVNFYNQTENALQELCFFLYANSFAEGQTPVSKANFNKAYPNGKSYGNITITGVEVDGNACDFAISENKNILSLDLGRELFPNESVLVCLKYVVWLANINHRLGYGNDTTNLANFFPILCVYENGFVKNDFSQCGDPFYSDIADFEVELTFPKDYVVASSGDCVMKNDTQLLVKAEKVRDFAIVLSKKFQVLTEEMEDIEVRYYFYDDGEAQFHLQTAKNAMKCFCEMFGTYPYKQVSVVQNDFCFGGMEYPNLVMISDQVQNKDIDYVIVHELAHQWWYGLVGNNEFAESWLDESLTEYSCALFFEKHAEYGLRYETIIQNAHDTYTNFVKVYTEILGDVDESMNRILSQFNTEPEYINCIYTKGVLLYDCLRQNVGDKKFFKCLKDYCSAFKFQNATTEKLVSSFAYSTGRNLISIFDAWLDGRVSIQ